MQQCQCDMVLYNERTDMQGEIDVVGVRGGDVPEVWLCEVATHIAGLGYGADFGEMTKKIANKLERAAAFARRLFPNHVTHLGGTVALSHRVKGVTSS